MIGLQAWIGSLPRSLFPSFYISTTVYIRPQDFNKLYHLHLRRHPASALQDLSDDQRTIDDLATLAADS